MSGEVLGHAEPSEIVGLDEEVSAKFALDWGSGLMDYHSRRRPQDSLSSPLPQDSQI